MSEINKESCCTKIPKVKQIQVGGKIFDYLFALCEDGSIWYRLIPPRKNVNWKRVPLGKKMYE